MSKQDPRSSLEMNHSTLELNQDASNPETLNQVPLNTESSHTTNSKPLHWIELHFPMILYIWFWFGLIVCAFFAPADRVLMLNSQMITKGWHLIVLSFILSSPIIWLYWKRVSVKSKK